MANVRFYNQELSGNQFPDSPALRAFERKAFEAS